MLCDEEIGDEKQIIMKIKKISKDLWSFVSQLIIYITNQNISVASKYSQAQNDRGLIFKIVPDGML